jgi:N-methylhydantoinase A
LSSDARHRYGASPSTAFRNRTIELRRAGGDVSAHRTGHGGGGYRLGVDVGGTFTDLLLVDTHSGRTWRAKTASTPADQALGVLSGISRICAAAGIDLARVDQVLHGTTVAANAILEGNGATVGLVTTRGFRQVLQIARSYVPGGLAGWIIWPKPEPLAALEHTVEVDERVGSDGRVIRPLDECDVCARLARLAGHGIGALAVSLINSFANPCHERRVGEIAAEVLPGIPVSLSCEVLPEMREYERTVSTVANSYVQPQVERYVRTLDRRLRRAGVRGGLAVLRSDGGLSSAESAIAAPVTILLSGPAGGVTGALWVAEQCGVRDFLTFDMGGTSTDVALVRGRAPRIGRDTTIGDLTVRSTSVDVRSVGAGGGSIAHVPVLTRALRVGPRSAGADPGPAAYGKGGVEPTVTDANVVLGYLPPSLAGGEIVLDVDAARAAVGRIAEAMGLASVEAAAAGIVDIVTENMLGGLRLVSVQQGFDPREFALIAFGGAGPLHANMLGRLTGSWPVIVPPSPGVLCALGDATTSLRDEAARTVLRRFADLTGGDLAKIVGELAAEAGARLAEQGLHPDEQRTSHQVDVRYHGQGYEIAVDVEPAWLDEPGSALDRLAAAFDAEHERLFSFLPNVDHELVNARATVTGPPPAIAATALPDGDGDPTGAVVGGHAVHVLGEWVHAVVYDRAKLRAGDVVAGPAIVTEMDSTTLVLPGHAATVHRSGCLLIRPAEG